MGMRDITEVADHHRCDAQEARMIAEGILDTNERKSLMGFIDSYERLAREVKTIDRRVIAPRKSES